MWYVYLLLCSDQSLYCGATNNLQKRLEAHQNKTGARYTRGRLPVKLVYFENALNKSAALKREVQIKKMSKKQKLQLIEQS